MIDKRLVDDPAAAPDGLRRVLDHGTSDVASDSELADLARGVGGALGIPVAALLGSSVGGAATTGGAAAAASKATSGLAGAKLAGLLAVGAALSAGGIAYLSSRSDDQASSPAPSGQPALPTQTPVSKRAPAVKEAESANRAPQSPSARALPPAASGKAGPAHAQPARTKPATASRPSESQLLNQAHAALSKDPRRALTLTARHRKLYPNGVLSQEREVIEIDAMKRLGQKRAAEQRAAEFEQDFEASPYRRKVESPAVKEAH